MKIKLENNYLYKFIKQIQRLGDALYIYSFEMMLIVLWCSDAAKVEDRRAGCDASHYRSDRR